MAEPRASLPAFGQADLSNCEREQIHLAGSIQPHGALLVIDGPGHAVVQASANAGEFLGLSGPVLGRGLGSFDGTLLDAITPHLGAPLLHTMPVAVRCQVGAARRTFDATMHRPPQGGLVIELEPAGTPDDHTEAVESATQRILGAFTLGTLCDETAAIIRGLTGYDRVMVYRFDQQGHGEILSEERLEVLEPFLGNHYPATDIPQIARRLYERKRIRVLVDIHYAPVPLEPMLSPLNGQQLDMSLCLLRSISPIHVQYLKNMGVGATLVISLMVGGRLWGLVACHHSRPRTVPIGTRLACELLAEAVSVRIAALESSARGQADVAVRRLEQRLIEAIGREGDWRGALFDNPPALLQPLRAAGAALLFEGQVTVTGEVPGTPQLREIGAWLDRRDRDAVVATASLGLDVAEFEPLRSVASGLVAAPLSRSPGEYLLWFRPEQVHVVTWGGDPNKAIVIGDSPMDLSPRRSFAQWHQLVERTSQAWTEADLTAARLIGDTLRDVILQFRSVSLLVAQEQLDRVRRQLRISELPVVVADPTGAILVLNDAFRALLGWANAAPAYLDDLPDLFAGTAEFRRRVQALCERTQTWRSEVRLRSSGKSMLVRADPVFSAPGHVSGYVVMLTDMEDQKAAEAARRMFQERIVERGGLAGQTDSEADLARQALMSAVVENAQLAAMEITDGVDTARMPEMLDSVRASVTRSRRTLDRLSWHTDSLKGQD